MAVSHVTRWTVMTWVVAVMTSSLTSAQTPNPNPHGPDSAVCTQLPDSPGTTLPNLPESFSVRVEANILYKKKTTTLHEYYSYDSNTAAVRQKENGQEGMFFYMYGSNQFLSVMPDSAGGYVCFKQDLSQNENRQFFGLQKVNGTSDRIYSVYGALHFGNGINEQYLGKNVTRGIPVNMWSSCQYWDSLDATSNVVWHFSDETSWSSVSGYTTPVRCHVTGVRWVNQTYSYNFEHIYEFYDFQADLTADDSHFEVPKNTYCYSETNTKPMYSMPSAYSFDAEMLDMNSKQISFIREEYDNKTRLMSYTYRDTPNANDPLNTRYVTQYHDFNTGVAYVIDVLRQNCTTTVLAGNSFDDINVDSGHVRMRNPNEFMALNYNYAYQGIRTIRGIECDSWATARTDYPTVGAQNAPTTWTWYYATANWMKSMGYRNNLVMPVMLEIFSDDANNPIHKQMSFYEYNAEEPDILKYDLSSCYAATDSISYAFLVPGRFRDVVAGDVKTFKYFVLLSLEAALNVSPLRIAHMDVQEAGSSVLVTFDLLDKAPLPGDVANPPNEVTLQQAYQVLDSAVNGGTLKIFLASPGFANNVNKITVQPAPAQYQISSRQRRSNPSTSSSGFSGGAMGGMAIGMLILGALVGFGVMFLVSKVRGGSLGGGMPMQRFGDQAGVVEADS